MTCGATGWSHDDGRAGLACTLEAGHLGGHLAIGKGPYPPDVTPGPKGNGTLRYALRYLLTEPRDALHHWSGTVLCHLGRHNPVCEGRRDHHPKH